MRSILEYARASGVADRIKIDPSLARGLSYYTGTIIEINVKDLVGSLGGGGRYDNLIGMFSGQDVPACGFSLGVERIIVVMTEREMFPPQLVASPADVMVAALGEEYVGYALTVARELRTAGMRVLLYPQPTDKLQKQLAYASAQNIAFVALSGEHEHNSGTVLIKDMHKRSQEWVTPEVAVDVIRDMLSVAKGTLEIERKREESSATITREGVRKNKDSI